MKTKQAFLGVVLTLAATVALVANAQLSNDDATAGTGDASDQTSAEVAAEISLSGQEWRLVSLERAPALENSRANALFQIEEGADGARFSASAGCNRLAGGLTQSADRLAFATNILSTKMACPPDLFQQEQTFLELLTRVRRYEVGADAQLRMFDDEGAELLTFEPTT